MNFTVTTSILRHLKANSLAIENSEKCKEIWRWKFWIIINYHAQLHVHVHAAWKTKNLQ